MTELLSRLLADPFVTTLLLGVAVTGIGLWLAACWWAFRDAHRRTASGLAPYLASAWIFLSGPILLPFSIGIYAMVRPLEPIADRKSRTLLASLDPAELEEPACPACGRPMDEEWRRCPTCSTWLGLRCDRCERWAPADATICPWCAWMPGEVADPATLVVRPLVPVLAPAGTPVVPVLAPLPAPAAAGVGADRGAAPAPTTDGRAAAGEPTALRPGSATGAWSRLRQARFARPAYVGPTIRSGQGRTPGSRPLRERGGVEQPGGPVGA